MTEYEHTSLSAAYTEFLNASPGDIISLMPGSYDNATRKNLTKTTGSLVTFRSKYPAAAVITGEPIDLGSVFTRFSGFDLQYDTANMEVNAADCILERCKINFNVASTGNDWVEIKQPRTVFQNNEIFGMTDNEYAVYVHNSVASGVVPSDCKILNNYWHDFPSGGGATPLTVGFSGCAARVLNCEIAGNVIERCDGDDEIMSIKSSNSYIHDNTISDCDGQLVLRQANDAIVDNNMLIDCGLRLYGRGHTITRNQILRDSRASFRMALVIGMGDVEDYPAPSDTGIATYGRSKGCTIEYNIIDSEDATSGNIFSWGYPSGSVHSLPPTGNTVRYNEIYASTGTLVDINDETHGASFANNTVTNNILHPTGSAVYGEVTGFGYIDADLRRYKKYDGSYRCMWVRHPNDVGVLAY